MDNLALNRQQKSYLQLKKLKLSIFFVLLALATSIVLFMKDFSAWVLPIAWLLLGLAYVTLFFYHNAAFKHFAYGLNDFGLSLNRGVFWRRKIIVPKNRVQHTDVVAGPLERRKGLASLLVFTAGTRNSMVRLPGILQSEAEKLRDLLSANKS